MSAFYRKKNGGVQRALEISTPGGIFDQQSAEAPEGWLKFASDEEAFLHFAAENASPLDQARSAMSGLLADLPKESRAKFAEIRAGIEKLLDLGDVEAAEYKLANTPTDTAEEETVKQTLVAALAQFLP